MIDYQLRGADYVGVTLLPSPFQKQRDETLELYLEHPSVDDILHRLRLASGIQSNARGMTGWGPSIGQYLGAYAKLYRNTEDDRVREKCMALFAGWCECAEKSDAALEMSTYVWEKMLGGLLDMYEFMGEQSVAPWIRRITDYAVAHFVTEIPRDGAQDERMLGQIEWYTLPENLYRAYQLLGDSVYLEFANQWLYPYMWDKLAQGDLSIGPRHAYSHVNSLSSAARAYIVTEDPHYLEVIRRGYEDILKSHTYATGGYGPAETLFGEEPGYLGDALLSTWDNQLDHGKRIVYKNFAGGRVARSDAWGSCEVSCCTWAVFKLCNYLLKLTGDARYGVWAERLLVNGVLGQPPITPKGQVLYYASYFLDGALKSYEDRRLQHLGQNFVWQCCTGTFPQDVAEYANMIAYYDDNGVSISQFIPAKIEFERDGRHVTLVSDGDFPAKPIVHILVHTDAPTSFALRIRMPDWAVNANSLRVCGKMQTVDAAPGTWLTIEREWHDGDEICLTMPYALKFEPVDAQHPNVVALRWGPMVLVSEEMTVLVGDSEHPEEWIQPVPGEENVFETLPGHTGVYDFVVRRFVPYYKVGLMQWYYMYNRIYPDLQALDREHQGF